MHTTFVSPWYLILFLTPIILISNNISYSYHTLKVRLVVLWTISLTVVKMQSKDLPWYKILIEN